LPIPMFEINETEKIKSSIDDPLDLELKDLPHHLECAFLEGTSKLLVIIAKDLKREEKEQLLKMLTEAPILVSLDWDLPFELMCDASDFAVGAVLGQRKDKYFRPIHYASKTLSDAQTHYTTTKKELLAVVYAFEKFRSYLVLYKTIEFMIKKGDENLAADHLSRLENPHQGGHVGMEINDNFPHESLNMISLNPDNEPL
ncbi:reverse transcriptase domain-containing protein, partial [Tanacetum coccineum]